MCSFQDSFSGRFPGTLLGQLRTAAGWTFEMQDSPDPSLMGLFPLPSAGTGVCQGAGGGGRVGRMPASLTASSGSRPPSRSSALPATAQAPWRGGKRSSEASALPSDRGPPSAGPRGLALLRPGSGPQRVLFEEPWNQDSRCHLAARTPTCVGSRRGWSLGSPRLPPRRRPFPILGAVKVPRGLCSPPCLCVSQ